MSRYYDSVTHIRYGIAYAGASAPAIRVNGVRTLDSHKLCVRFTTGEEKTFDFTPLLEMPCYAPLKGEAIFKGVYIDYGYPVWMEKLILMLKPYIPAACAVVVKMPDEFARRIADERKKQGISQEELSAQGSNISRLKSGRYNPTIEFHDRLAAGLGKKLYLEFR